MKANGISYYLYAIPTTYIDCCLLFQLFSIPDPDGMFKKGTGEEILNIPITSASGISVHISYIFVSVWHILIRIKCVGQSKE